MHPGKLGLWAFALLALVALHSAAYAQTAGRVSSFTLDNGMQVVVIPDHRVPVVTHMIWYRAGGADEPPGRSGIAHFLEHLMFKSTGKIKSGEFSRIISRLGGVDNAKTTHDATYYYQRAAKEHLRSLMELEAERMVNLKLLDEEVRVERQVIKEERRSSIDADPIKVLNEQMMGVLYQNHPYGVPVQGWPREVARLSRADAAAFYRRFYAPNNAILVVAGDVTPAEVKALAAETYGKNKPNPALTPRMRPLEPHHPVARRVRMIDARTGAATLFRFYIAPGYGSAKVGEAESIDLLMTMLGEGESSRLYKSLVVEQKLAAAAGARFFGSGRDYGRMVVFAIAAKGVAPERLEKALDRLLDEVRTNGVTQAELARAKASFEATFVFESDNQTSLARRFGKGLTSGRSIAGIEAWPARIENTTLADVNKTAAAYLQLRRSVTGTLIARPAAKTARSRQ